MKYEGIVPLTREQAEQDLSGANAEKIVCALLSIGNHESDWQWAQDRALSFMQSPRPEVRRAAVMCLGDLARIHRRIERAKVLPALKELLADPECSGQAEDAIDDIEVFTKEAA